MKPMSTFSAFLVTSVLVALVVNFWYICIPLLTVAGLYIYVRRKNDRIIEQKEISFRDEQDVILRWHNKGDIRVSEVDRDIAKGILTDSLNNMSLGFEEYIERFDKVQNATYRRELANVVKDLPMKYFVD